MWYSSRGENDGRRVRPWTVTSSYLHWDVGYGILFSSYLTEAKQLLMVAEQSHLLSVDKIKQCKWERSYRADTFPNKQSTGCAEDFHHPLASSQRKQNSSPLYWFGEIYKPSTELNMHQTSKI